MYTPQYPPGGLRVACLPALSTRGHGLIPRRVTPSTLKSAKTGSLPRTHHVMEQSDNWLAQSEKLCLNNKNLTQHVKGSIPMVNHWHPGNHEISAIGC